MLTRLLRFFSLGLYKGGASRPDASIADWLETGPDSKTTIADWLEQPTQNRHSEPGREPLRDHKKRASSKNSASDSPSGEPSSAPTSTSIHRYLGIGSLLLGALVTVGFLKEPYDVWPPLRAGLMVAITSMILLEVLACAWNHWKFILPIGSGIGVTIVVAVGDNQYCLGPIDEADQFEQGICLSIGVFAKPLAPMVDVQTDLVPHEATGQNGAGPLWNSIAAGTAVAAPFIARDNALGSFSTGERDRFNSCSKELYENPAVKIQAWVMRKYSISRDDAHDAVMDALIAVCERYMTQQLDDLRPFYWQAAKNRVIDIKRRHGKFPNCNTIELEPDYCYQDDPMVLFKSERNWFDQALCSLSPNERRVLTRRNEGGSWTDIGDDLEMDHSSAANTFNNGIRKLRTFVENKRCQRTEQFQPTFPVDQALYPDDD